ncbi:MAG: hypothetical protein QW478_01595 [Candidatus Micrarchaeaceae archaeon]
MQNSLNIYFSKPLELIVYTLMEKNTVKIFNAYTLEKIDNPNIDEYIDIEGEITDKFNTHPAVVLYKNGLLQIVYAPPDMPYVFDSHGNVAKHFNVPIEAKAKITIPKVEKGGLKPQNLQQFNSATLQQFIQLSKMGKEQDCKETYDELKEKNNVPTVIVSNAKPENIVKDNIKEIFKDEGLQEPNKTPKLKMKSPSPRKKEDNEKWEADLQSLKRDVEQLKEIITIINQRLYRLYPVNIPNFLQTKNGLAPLISVEEINKKIQNNEIEKCELDPLLQPYAGSHRSNNRLLTYTSKNGEIYCVRAEYNPSNNQISNPK